MHDNLLADALVHSGACDTISPTLEWSLSWVLAGNRDSLVAGLHSCWVPQVEAHKTDLQHLHNQYRDSRFSRRFNVTLEDRSWALDCVRSRSVAVPHPLSELMPQFTPQFTLT